MLKVIKVLLQKIISDIDAGNSNITEEEAVNVAKTLQSYTDKTKKLSKYQACLKLNISRATFDNLVKDGILPKGQKVPGFKELFWIEKDLDKIIKNNKPVKHK